jgi:TetR/AcrR family transcriptional regulator, transcriptional repressor for nem operon
MKVSREQFAENRQKILEAAGRLFREHGFDGVTVADVMKAAGLTHGGFYGHFKSKDDLIAQTLAHSSGQQEPPDMSLADYARYYLSTQHCHDAAGGCTVAGLGPDTVRQSPEARAAMTARLRAQIERLARAAPGTTPEEKRRHAIVGWAAMLGSLLMARVSDDAALRDEILAATRDWLVDEEAAPENAPRN